MVILFFYQEIKRKKKFSLLSEMTIRIESCVLFRLRGCLAHVSVVSFLCDICKQCIPWSERHRKRLLIRFSTACSQTIL